MIYVHPYKKKYNYFGRQNKERNMQIPIKKSKISLNTPNVTKKPINGIKNLQSIQTNSLGDPNKEVINELTQLETQLESRKCQTLPIHLPIDLTFVHNYENSSLNIKDLQNAVSSDTIDVQPIDRNSMMHHFHSTSAIQNILPKHHRRHQTQCKIQNRIYQTTATKLIHTENINNKQIYCCWHCTKEIEPDQHIGIPTKFENEQFHIFGFFCSYNCALTYNYNSTERDHVIQEREALLRFMYKSTNTYNNKPFQIHAQELKYAPKKECLKKFGGLLSMEEFHANHEILRDIVYYPVVSLSCFMEENVAIN